MPLANAPISPFLEEVRVRHLGSVEKVVSALAMEADRLTVKDGSAVLCPAASFPNQGSIKESYMDWTGFESVANQIHIEDFATGMDAVEMLGQAIGFSKVIQRKVNSPDLPLRFIISLDKFEGQDECIFSFHVIRPSESWLARDIDGYREPILTWTSSESAF
jgi:hypothetical protein